MDFREKNVSNVEIDILLLGSVDLNIFFLDPDSKKAILKKYSVYNYLKSDWQIEIKIDLEHLRPNCTQNCVISGKDWISPHPSKTIFREMNISWYEKNIFY